MKLVGDGYFAEQSAVFGKAYTIAGLVVTEKELPEIQKLLKNSLADANPPDAQNLWEQIQSLNLTDSCILLFVLRPETKLLPKQIEFQFQFNEIAPSQIFKAYSFTLQAQSQVNPNFGYAPPGYYYPYSGTAYGMYGGYGFVPYSVSTQLSGHHNYVFVLKFPKSIEQFGTNRLKIKTPYSHIWELYYEKN